MSQLAHLNIEPRDAIDFMGPACVIATAGPQITVRRSDGREVDVELALALPYTPVEDDLLLIISGAEGHYVIGVLCGKGKTSLALQGDVELHAVGGTLDLKADRAVRVQGPEVEITTDKMRVLADAAVHKVSTLYQHVRSLWSMKANKVHTAVDGDIYQRSKSATVLTEEVVTINGKQIHLG